MVHEPNDALDKLEGEPIEMGGAQALSIQEHRWKEGQLEFLVEWSSNEETWHKFQDMREDFPFMTAKYIVVNHVTRSLGRDPKLTWAKKMARDVRREVRRLEHCSYLLLDETSN